MRSLGMFSIIQERAVNEAFRAPFPATRQDPGEAQVVQATDRRARKASPARILLRRKARM